MMLAVATMSHLMGRKWISQWILHFWERRRGNVGLEKDTPCWEAIDEPSEGYARRVADDGWEGSCEGHGPEDEPAAGEVLPALGDGF